MLIFRLVHKVDSGGRFVFTSSQGCIYKGFSDEKLAWVDVAASRKARQLLNNFQHNVAVVESVGEAANLHWIFVSPMGLVSLAHFDALWKLSDARLRMCANGLLGSFRSWKCFMKVAFFTVTLSRPT